MHFQFRNVNDAFAGLVTQFYRKGNGIRSRDSRNGKVLLFEEPVSITYSHPRERVLFNSYRDCNPFMHLYEGLYHLTGRNDLAPLQYYSSKMGDYSDDGKTLNGAYGYRWRHAYAGSEKYGDYQGEDQLRLIIQHLKSKPDSRRAALSMWNVEDDLLKIATPGESSNGSRDVCCNLNILFSIREENYPCPYCQGKCSKPSDCHVCLGTGKDLRNSSLLDITVFNRSNDLIWGALGANYVTFSILQEYVASHLGVGIGRYNQISNNLHVYEWNFKPEEWLVYYSQENQGYSRVDYLEKEIAPLVKNPKIFNVEVKDFVELHSKDAFAETYSEPFFTYTAQIMLLAYHYHKKKQDTIALSLANQVADPYWRRASVEWLERRIERKKNKEKKHA